MKKLLLILSISLLWLCTFAQLNFEQACSKAQSVASDGEIMEVMASHGFELEDPFAEITVLDKVTALVNLLGKEDSNG